MSFASDSSFHLSSRTTILLLNFFFFPPNERLIQKDHGNYGEVWYIQSHLASLYFCLCSPTQRITCRKRRWTSLYVSSRATVVEKHEFWIGCISDVKYEIKMSRDHVLTVMSSNYSLYSIPNLKFVFFFFWFYLVYPRCPNSEASSTIFVLNSYNSFLFLFLNSIITKEDGNLDSRCLY